MLKAVIIDDEEDAVQFISSILAEYCPDIEIAGTGNSALQGIKAINHHHPDLVFLDIEMPDGTGFDLLESLSNRDFEVIFVTAYNQYAIHAFKFSAVDYIMKPVNIRELLAAVERVREKRRTPGGMKPDYKAVIENVRADSPEKLALPTAHEIEYVNIRDIIRFEADGRYSTVFLAGSRKIVVSKNLAEYEELLGGRTFFRTHNSHLVNLEHVRKIVKTEGGYMEMSDGSTVDISRRRKDELLKQMSALSKGIKS